MPLELHLYKFLMYESGCHFVKHRDTEKDDRMFATLVIQLPSVHQGGQLVVHHPNGTRMTHDFGHAEGTAAYAPHYAVHFADSEHELLAVTSGYRLALVYSICWPQGHKQVDLVRTHEGPHHQVSAHMSQLATTQSAFHLFCEHQYTLSSLGQLGLKALKGADRASVALLRSANGMLADELKFTFVMVTGQRTVTRDGRLDETEESDVSEYYGTWYDEAGRQLPEGEAELGLLVNPRGLSETDLWDGFIVDESKEYTGNAGYDTMTCYEKHILVAIPGPWALSAFYGVQATFDHCIAPRLTSNAFLSSVASGMPTSTTEPIKLHLLSVAIDRHFASAIPALFRTINDPLAIDMIPMYVGAMQSPPAWTELSPLIVSAMSAAPDTYSFGLQLALDAATTETVDEATWRDLLESATARLIVQSELASVCAVFKQIARVPHVWQAVHERLLVALATLDATFHFGMQHVFDLLDAGADAGWVDAVLHTVESRSVPPSASELVRFADVHFARAAREPQVWSRVFACIRDAVATAAVPVDVGLRVVLEAIEHGVAEHEWQALLTLAVGKPISTTDLVGGLKMTQPDSILCRAIRIPAVWQVVAAPLAMALSRASDNNAMAVGIDFIAIQVVNGASEADLAPFFDAISKLPLPHGYFNNDGLPLYVKSALEIPLVWRAIGPAVASALQAMDASGFEPGLRFLVAALSHPDLVVDLGDILAVLATLPISLDVLARLIRSPNTPLTLAITMPQVWDSLSPAILSVLSSFPDALVYCAAFVSGVLDGQNVPESTWSELLIVASSAPASRNGWAAFLRSPQEGFGRLLTRVSEAWSHVGLAVAGALTNFPDTFDVVQVQGGFVSLPSRFGLALSLLVSLLAANLQDDQARRVFRLLSVSTLHPDQVSLLSPLLVQAMQAPSVPGIDLWTGILGTVQDALSRSATAFETGLYIVTLAKDHDVVSDKWAQLVPTTFARMTIPSPTTMTSWPAQSSLWRILSIARDHTAYQSAVNAYLAANQPSLLDIPITEILSILPTIPIPQVVIPLIQSRYTWLHHLLADLQSRGPTWVIPNASYPDDSHINDFLRSDQETVRVGRGIFSSKSDASQWARTHRRAHPKVSMSAGGKGRAAYVEMTKDWSVRQVDRARMARVGDELARLADVLRQLAPAQVG